MENKTKHTPGEWKVRIDMYDDSHYVFTENFGIISILGCTDEDESNALLIAAAPEMLEALQEFCCIVEPGEVRSIKTHNKFKALIKKATGDE